MYLHTRGYDPTTSVSRHMRTVLRFVRDKVLGLHTEERFQQLIFVCYRYGLRPLRPSHQETMLDRHGATLLRVHDDVDQRTVDVGYLPEPLVGEMLCSVRHQHQRHERRLLGEGSGDTDEDVTEGGEAQRRGWTALDSLPSARSRRAAGGQRESAARLRGGHHRQETRGGRRHPPQVLGALAPRRLDRCAGWRSPEATRRVQYERRR